MIEFFCPMRHAGSNAQTYAGRLAVCPAAMALAAAILLGWVSITRAQVPAPQPPAGGANALQAPPNLPGMVPKPETAAEEPPTAAERVIDEAIEKIRKLQSIAADIEESVDVLKQTFKITGRYRKAQNHRVYLLLTVSGLTDSSGTALQVCDGETLWDFQQILDNQLYQKKSVKPIMERLSSPELDPKFRDEIMTKLGFAGPETLLIGLRKTIKFDQKEEGTLDGKKVWLLRGTWKNRQGLVGPDARPVAAVGLLPPYIPCDATLYLGKDDSWPYQLIVVGRKPSAAFDTRRIGPDGHRIGSKSSIEEVVPSRIQLVYSNVKLNPTIRPSEFAFQPPPSASVDDATDLIVRGLDQAILAQADRKKNEAAKKETPPVIEQPLDIPPPPGSPR
jgi:hypothetical protein